jgi:homoserine kinase
VAGVVAANALLDQPLALPELLPYALLGEAVASGGIHADNVAPALFGGLVLVRSAREGDIVRLPAPQSLRCVIALPDLRIDTRHARAVLPAAYPLAVVIEQGANLAALVAGLYSGDISLIGRSLRDVLIEPHRAALIQGFDDVQRAARGQGALGCSISGAGPAMFAWCDGDDIANGVREAMVAAFVNSGVAAHGWVSRVDGPGAKIEDDR